MGMSETQVWNRTDAKIEVKEGNGGIFNSCTPLVCNAKHKVRIESDTTYRTFKVLRMGDTMNNEHYVDLDSDFLLDHRVVCIRVTEQGRCYRDGILRKEKAATKEIMNSTGETVVVRETANVGEHTGRLTVLTELRHGESVKVEVVDPNNRARALRYSVEIKGNTTRCSTEITAEDFARNAVVEVSLRAAGDDAALFVGQRVNESLSNCSFRKSIWPWDWFKKSLQLPKSLQSHAKL